MNTVLATQSPATKPQIAELHRQFDLKFDAEKASESHAWLNTHRISKALASIKIDELWAMPTVRKAFSHAAENEIEIGMYTVDGVIYKVQRAVHGSGHLYAKRWDAETESFDIESGAIRKIKAEHRMSAAEAGAFGLIISACAHCGKTLTDEESIARGLGPICAGKYA